ncbi:MAG: hypothetical protein JW954_03215 [Dehalococcoidaceae bacterium]|nr:hypothetical protein [Dehalococcoidaceae bacterium]
MFELAFEYYGLVVLLSTATIQLSSSFAGLKGIMFIHNPKANCIMALFVMVPCLGAIATWNWRNPTGIIEGGQQFFLFMLAIVSAIALNIIISSIANHRRFKTADTPLEDGFEALKSRTYLQAIMARLRNFKWRG